MWRYEDLFSKGSTKIQKAKGSKAKRKTKNQKAKLSRRINRGT